jgi:hypothetical protein
MRADRTSVNDSRTNFVIATNAAGGGEGGGPGEGKWRWRGGYRKGVDETRRGSTLGFRHSGVVVLPRDRDLHRHRHRRRCEPDLGGRGLFRGLNTHTPPPVGGVYRLRAIPTVRRGTDTRYQRTLVAPEQ